MAEGIEGRRGRPVCRWIWSDSYILCLQQLPSLLIGGFVQWVVGDMYVGLSPCICHPLARPLDCDTGRGFHCSALRLHYTRTESKHGAAVMPCHLELMARGEGWQAKTPLWGGHGHSSGCIRLFRARTRECRGPSVSRRRGAGPSSFFLFDSILRQQHSSWAGTDRRRVIGASIGVWALFVLISVLVCLVPSSRVKLTSL